MGVHAKASLEAVVYHGPQSAQSVPRSHVTSDVVCVAAEPSSHRPFPAVAQVLVQTLVTLGPESNALLQLQMDERDVWPVGRVTKRTYLYHPIPL